MLYDGPFNSSIHLQVQVHKYVCHLRGNVQKSYNEVVVDSTVQVPWEVYKCLAAWVIFILIGELNPNTPVKIADRVCLGHIPSAVLLGFHCAPVHVHG